MDDAPTLYLLGSPPRVRGRLGLIDWFHNRRRFTPACAGQTTCMAWRESYFAVHPRVCGADEPLVGENHFATGSPPRVRGRRALRHDKPPTTTVHPRVCGADPFCQHFGASVTGSPPRVRGRRLAAVTLSDRRRFTPACAGQTPLSSGVPHFLSVHPRVCGADRKVTAKTKAVIGSPPRVRGRLSGAQDTTRRRRFTPACAGQTPRKWQYHRHRQVHPRVCGADAVYLVRFFCRYGSPPRVRGRRAAE